MSFAFTNKPDYMMHFIHRYGLFLILFQCYSSVSAQDSIHVTQPPLNESDIEKMLEGTWHFTSEFNLLEADTLGLHLQPEEVLYMVFEENHSKVRFSSYIDNQYHEGRYRVYYDNKSKNYHIKFKKPFGSCETESIQVVSLSDSSLVIRSCINPIAIHFKKSPTPNEKIKNVRNLLIGSWSYTKTVIGQNCSVSNPVDSVVSYDFSIDSVDIHVKSENNPIIIKSPYTIIYDLDYDKFSVYTPDYVRESCGQIPVLYIDEIVKDKMILTKCDNDHYRVFYEKMQTQEESRMVEIKSFLQGRSEYNMTAWAFGEDSHRTGEDTTTLIFIGDSLQIIFETESGSVVRKYGYQLIVFENNPGAQLIILDYYSDGGYTVYTRNIEQVDQDTLIFEGKTNDKLHVWFSKVQDINNR